MKGNPDKDLWLIGITTVSLALVVAFLPATPARIILGLPFLLFFPGYTLVAALFPKKQSLGAVERVALSFGLSIAVVPLIGLALNFTPWGVRLEPILISISSFVIVTAGVAWYRRERLAPQERVTVSLNFRLPSWREQSKPDKVLSIVLIVAVMATLGTLGYAIATPRAGEKFTEFYILGPDGEADGYPTQLKVGEEGRLLVGLINHEQQTVSYEVEIWIDGEKTKLRFEGGDQDQIALELESEGKWERQVSFVPQKPGRQKVELVLYKNGAPCFDQSLHLWIEVEEP